MPIQSIGTQCFTCARTSTVFPSTATSNSHSNAFVLLLSETSAVLCNVLTPSTEVWRAKSTLFLLPSPVATVGIRYRECQYCAYAGSQSRLHSLYNLYDYTETGLVHTHTHLPCGKPYLCLLLLLLLLCIGDHRAVGGRVPVAWRETASDGAHHELLELPLRHRGSRLSHSCGGRAVSSGRGWVRQ